MPKITSKLNISLWIFLFVLNYQLNWLVIVFLQRGQDLTAPSYAWSHLFKQALWNMCVLPQSSLVTISVSAIDSKQMTHSFEWEHACSQLLYSLNVVDFRFWISWSTSAVCWERSCFCSDSRMSMLFTKY